MKKALQISNGIALVSTIIINYLSNTGKINNTTIGEVSNQVNSLFAPAGYAFSIWGFIYLLLLGFIVYQGRSLFIKVKSNNDFILKTGWWFVISCIANSAWVFSWLYGYTGLSCIFIFILLISLLKIVLNNSMELWDAPFPIILFVWWPFTIYSGWVTVASIANVSSYLVKSNWEGFGISEVNWTLIMIVVATIINLLVTWKRNMREFALVGAWALFAIAIANKDGYSSIFYTAIIATIVLVLNSFYHGFKNRATSPFIKYRQYRENKR